MPCSVPSISTRAQWWWSGQTNARTSAAQPQPHPHPHPHPHPKAWAYSRHYMGAVIIGATSIAQLEANWKAATFVLPPEALAEIDAIHCRHRNPNLQD